ncbi:MAG: ergothioneine biosynthesis protein EgtB [Actinomycetota bacterium]|nr:ergothioneine biosynthesis protein EgtB [Actinomycetota bacterium]
MTHPTGRKVALTRALQEGRRLTLALLAPLGDDAVHRQHDPIMSPLAWDLGHIGNYEELWLLRALGERSLADPALDRVYNPFENPRPARAELPILPRAEATAYLAEVRSQALRLLRATDLDPGEPLLADGFVYELVAQHEAMHQETMLQALDLRPDATADPLAARPTLATVRGPLAAYLTLAAARGPGPAAGRVPVGRPVDDCQRVVVPAGPFAMGTDDRTRAFDNERPAHPVHVASFALDRFPVTARRYAAFIAGAGYDRPELWSERGWAWRSQHGHATPQGWLPDGEGGWLLRRFHHVAPLDPRQPVEHVSYFEAEAFATWAGGRLPTEAEWEKAAAWDPAANRARTWPWGERPPSPTTANVDRRVWGPAAVGSFPAGASAYGAEQLVGDCYEWTSSGFEPYPAYATFPYPEYSEVFFGGDYRVLRGASWASRSAVTRATFRNWDHPYRRQIFAGFRLAWDIGG